MAPGTHAPGTPGPPGAEAPLQPCWWAPPGSPLVSPCLWRLGDAVPRAQPLAYFLSTSRLLVRCPIPLLAREDAPDGWEEGSLVTLGSPLTTFLSWHPPWIDGIGVSVGGASPASRSCVTVKSPRVGVAQRCSAAHPGACVQGKGRHS